MTLISSKGLANWNHCLYVVLINEIFNSLYTENPQMGTLTNRVDPDEMPHNAAFHQGLHCDKVKAILRDRNTP